MQAVKIVEKTSSGAVKATGGIVYSFSLTAADGVDGTAQLRNGGSDGTIVATLKAAKLTSAPPLIFPNGVDLSAGIYVTLTGTGVVSSVGYW